MTDELYGWTADLKQPQENVCRKTLESMERWIVYHNDRADKAEQKLAKVRVMTVDEVAKIALIAFEKRYDKNYSRDTNIDYMRAAAKTLAKLGTIKIVEG